MTAEELLATAEPLAEDGTYCTIDPETRLITIPPEYQLLGVENDKRVERLYFRCPKIVGDNQDLSQGYQIFINYQNANGDPDAYHINDMEIDGDDITFSWLLEENVTKYKGNIQIAFGAIKPGDESEDPDKNRWNTTINTDCTCLIGLKCTQQVAESNPDALAQIWAAIDELKAGGGGSGTPGKDGREIEIQNNGTAIQWRYVGDGSWTDLVQLSEITGAKGDPGEDGITPTIGENGNWYLGETDTGKPSRGEKGPAGQDGNQGPVGQTGATPDIQIGSVQTLEPGQPATASISGTPENPLLNLGIPKGETGGGESGGGITEETDPTVPAWAKNPTKPNYTATEVGADASGTAESKVSAHNAAADAHNDIRLSVQGLTDRLNALADSDDDTLDQMSEIVAYIKSNKSLIDAITTQKVSVSDIIDNLTTDASNKPLSAAQGVALKVLIDGITIPETLPNPHKLIFTGAVSAEYDGSTEQTVNIPESSGSSADIPRQEMQNTDTTVTLDPNKLYVFPEMASLTVTLAEPSDTNVANEYHFFFTSGATATTLTLNDVLSDAYSIEANMKYEVSILEGVAYIKGVAISAA